jgi:DNA polymerase
MVKPQALVLLGATAAQALLGSQIRIGRDRGKPVESELAELVTLTAHPSSILRSRTDEERAEAMAAFVSDFKAVARWLNAR